MTFKALVWQTGSNIKSCEVRWAIALRFWQGWAITKHRSPHHRKNLGCNSEHQYWRETAGLLRAAPRPKAEKSACQVRLIEATGANHGAQTLCGRLRERDRSGPQAHFDRLRDEGFCARCWPVCACVRLCARMRAGASDRQTTIGQQAAGRKMYARTSRLRSRADAPQHNSQIHCNPPNVR